MFSNDFNPLSPNPSPKQERGVKKAISQYFPHSPLICGLSPPLRARRGGRGERDAKERGGESRVLGMSRGEGKGGEEKTLAFFTTICQNTYTKVHKFIDLNNISGLTRLNLYLVFRLDIITIAGYSYF